MSREQREALDELLREGPLDLGGDVSQQRKSTAQISPLFADLTGLPPLLIQAGSHEVLLDDG